MVSVEEFLTSDERDERKVCNEAFSVPPATAATLQRPQPADPDLYLKLTSAVEKNEAKQLALAVPHFTTTSR